MDFHTRVELPKDLPLLTHDVQIMLMGSCFAENVGILLRKNKLNVGINPYGILYNPLSAATVIREIANGKVYTEEDLFEYREYWHSRMHHGSFSAATPEKALLQINSRLKEASSRFPTLEYLMLTWGTAFVYRQKENGNIVSNCHKQPESCFDRRILSVDEIVQTYASLLTELAEQNPKLKIVATVSPIRHIRDGFHANQISKSTLLLALDQLQRQFSDRLFYFPSYEIVMDELRDYRFYAEDMLHPSNVTLEYLWKRFSEVFFSPETELINIDVSSIYKDLSHKPYHPEAEDYQRFLKQIVLKIERLTRKYPYLDFKNEIELCHTRLNP